MLPEKSVTMVPVCTDERRGPQTLGFPPVVAEIFKPLRQQAVWRRSAAGGMLTTNSASAAPSKHSSGWSVLRVAAPAASSARSRDSPART
jgi:hypothetical protein